MLPWAGPIAKVLMPASSHSGLRQLRHQQHAALEEGGRHDDVQCLRDLFQKPGLPQVIPPNLML